MARLQKLVFCLLLVLCVTQLACSQGKKPETEEDDGITIEEENTESRTGKALSKTSNKNGLLALTRGIWDNFRSSSPVFMVLSMALGAFVGSFLLDSPLSPFPVPPLPGPPLGRFPPYQQAIPVPVLPSSYNKVPASYPAYQKYAYGRSLDLNNQTVDEENVEQRTFNSSGFQELMANYEAKEAALQRDKDADQEEKPKPGKNNGISEAWDHAIRTLTEFLVNLQKRTALYAETSKSSNQCMGKSDCNRLDNKEAAPTLVGT